jgi:outer membrane protein assembly factor BamE (lipoprotein component of BamABCDE complex)
MLLIMTSCINTITRGHLKEDEAVASVKVGTTTKDEALKLLGSPSSESSFGPTTWYYVSSIKQSRSIMKPEIIDQHVTEIAFDSSGVVSSLKEYSLKDSKDVEIATRTTPSEGQELGFFEQLLGNLGRFNDNNNNSTSNSHTHGTIPNVGAPPNAR